MKYTSEERLYMLDEGPLTITDIERLYEMTSDLAFDLFAIEKQYDDKGKVTGLVLDPNFDEEFYKRLAKINSFCAKAMNIYNTSKDEEGEK